MKVKTIIIILLISIIMFYVGIKIGYNNGINDGFNNGKNNGFLHGYKKGYIDGYKKSPPIKPLHKDKKENFTI